MRSKIIKMYLGLTLGASIITLTSCASRVEFFHARRHQKKLETHLLIWLFA